MSLDREGAPQAVVVWGRFRIPKDLKCVERREAGRGAGVHAPHAKFTFRTYCRPLGTHRSVVTRRIVGFRCDLALLASKSANLKRDYGDDRVNCPKTLLWLFFN